MQVKSTSLLKNYKHYPGYAYYPVYASLIAMLNCGIIGLYHWHKTNGSNLFSRTNRDGCIAMIIIASLVIASWLTVKIRGICNRIFDATYPNPIYSFNGQIEEYTDLSSTQKEESKKTIKNIIKTECFTVSIETLTIGLTIMLTTGSIGLDYFLKTGENLFTHANENTCIAMIAISAIVGFIACAFPLGAIIPTLIDKVKATTATSNASSKNP
ncbi:MAG: hypothetical protein OEY79_01115 [Anaplasmataceae bacterium]|nr:hypothetical protein [Anaplasmataceae bacterium]